MTIMNLVSLLAGLGVFLYGMHLMGEALEKAAGSKLKHLLEVVTHNRFLAMLAGLTITAVVQSSTATTVMVVGFVNANLLTLTQAVGVIMGANVGTTVTSLLLSVQIDFGAIFACAGLLLSHAPKKLKNAATLSNIAIGLGLMFIGMSTMSTAMAPLREWEGFQRAITSVDNPLAGVLIGAAITAVLHSSAASVGILQALVGEGLVPLHTAIFILFGQNIGTCVTSMVASRGTSTAAQRTAVVHLLFNVLGTIIFLILGLVLPLTDWIQAIAPSNLRLQIATTHIFFNVGTTALLLPAAGLLERIARLVIPDRAGDSEPMRLKFFDDRLMNTPPIAVAQLFRETQRMGDIARANLSSALACFVEHDPEAAATIEINEDVLDYLNKEITDRLTRIKGLDLSEGDTRLVGEMFHVVNDIERVGDHAMNILENARNKAENDIRFSGKVLAELTGLSEEVTAQLDRALEIFKKQTATPEQLEEVEQTEAHVDEETQQLRNHHVERVKARKCSARNGMLYLDMLTNLERVADHAENIATILA